MTQECAESPPSPIDVFMFIITGPRHPITGPALFLIRHLFVREAEVVADFMNHGLPDLPDRLTEG